MTRTWADYAATTRFPSRSGSGGARANTSLQLSDDERAQLEEAAGWLCYPDVAVLVREMLMREVSRINRDVATVGYEEAIVGYHKRRATNRYFLIYYPLLPPSELRGKEMAVNKINRREPQAYELGSSFVNDNDFNSAQIAELMNDPHPMAVQVATAQLPRDAHNEDRDKFIEEWLRGLFDSQK